MSQNSKNVIYFYVRQLEMPQNAFQKSDVIIFTCFFGNCTAKNKDIALKFCMLVICMHLHHIYSGFLDNLASPADGWAQLIVRDILDGDEARGVNETIRRRLPAH